MSTLRILTLALAGLKAALPDRLLPGKDSHSIDIA